MPLDMSNVADDDIEELLNFVRLVAGLKTYEEDDEHEYADAVESINLLIADARDIIKNDPPKSDLFEIDGEPAEVCPDCGAIEGTPEWGTVGDGFDGYCGDCADKREATGEVEIG